MSEKSPERLMLECVELGQKIRKIEPGTKSIHKLWKEWDAVAAEAIAALAHKLQPITEEQKEELRKIGNGLGVVLKLRIHTQENERWATRWGSKTGLGLVLILERFIHHVNGNYANAEDRSNSLADKCRSLQAEAEKEFQKARMRAAQERKRQMNQREFYAKKGDGDDEA